MLSLIFLTSNLRFFYPAKSNSYQTVTSKGIGSRHGVAFSDCNSSFPPCWDLGAANSRQAATGP